jgi:hypothetical protein
MNLDGKSVALSDDKMQVYEFKSVPGYEHTLVWLDPTTLSLRIGQGFVRNPSSVVQRSLRLVLIKVVTRPRNIGLNTASVAIEACLC